MKKIIISSIVIFLLFSCFTKKPEPIYQNIEINKVDNNKDFLIVKIDSIDNVIVLYAKRNDSVFKIASLKQFDKNCNKVTIGKSYNLKIKSFFPENYPQKLDIKGFKVSKTIIKLEKKGVVWDLFSSENIKGLCYIK